MQLETYFLQFDLKVLFQLSNFQFFIYMLVFVINWTNHSSQMYFPLNVILILQVLNKTDALLILFYNDKPRFRSSWVVSELYSKTI